ncbi:MAG: PadR family transcriptional regulator [Firmicutes bacterium]|nr:PadR family transcriptional regulator [Bacillota bacterium]
MDAQLKKGLLDACILAAINKGDSYGYKLIEDTKTIIEISESTLYPILRRLEAGGYLRTHTKEYDGRLRKYYAITTSGKVRLQEYKAMMNSMKIIYEKLFEEVK